MIRNWLVVDANYLARQAFHREREDSDAVIPSFLASVSAYTDRLRSEDLVFCFDRPPYRRRDEFPWYKQREERTDPDVMERFRAELVRLRNTVLPELGFGNVFFQRGYEADDVMASVCANLPGADTAVLVTADRDMEQLLSPRVSRFEAQNGPSKGFVRTAAMFTNEWGIEPKQWAKVKAIAGCGTDTVPGVKWVGESTAVQYLRGGEFRAMVPETRRRAIEAFCDKQQYLDNLRVIELPYPGTADFVPAPDAGRVPADADWRSGGIKRR